MRFIPNCATSKKRIIDICFSDVKIYAVDVNVYPLGPQGVGLQGCSSLGFGFDGCNFFIRLAEVLFCFVQTTSIMTTVPTQGLVRENQRSSHEPLCVRPAANLCFALLGFYGSAMRVLTGDHRLVCR